MNLMNLVLLVVLIYMLWNIFVLNKKRSKQKRMLQMLDKIGDEDAYFEEADNLINSEKDAEFQSKIAVLRLWGDVYYQREEFAEHLTGLNIEALYGKKPGKGFTNNEDSFFYLYLAMPNHLWSLKQMEKLKQLDEKLETVSETNEGQLLKQIYLENYKFYTKQDDYGKTFIQKLLDGDYGEYSYNKQLIGLYKQCEQALLARIMKDAQNTEEYESLREGLKGFETSRLGTRWLKECGVEPIKNPEEESSEEETQEVYEAKEPEDQNDEAK